MLFDSGYIRKPDSPRCAMWDECMFRELEVQGFVIQCLQPGDIEHPLDLQHSLSPQRRLKQIRKRSCIIAVLPGQAPKAENVFEHPLHLLQNLRAVSGGRSEFEKVFASSREPRWGCGGSDEGSRTSTTTFCRRKQMLSAENRACLRMKMHLRRLNRCRGSRR